MRLLNRKFDSCEWHEHLKENEIICDDNTVYIVSADADDSNGLEILANAGLENGENYFITQRFYIIQRVGLPYDFITDELGKFEKI